MKHAVPPSAVEWTSERTLRFVWNERPDRFAQHAAAWSRALTGACGIRDAVPGVRTLTLLVDPLVSDPGEVERFARETIERTLIGDVAKARTHELPVCFDAGFAPDLERVAHTDSDPVRTLTGATLTVALFGFAPGFPYLDGLPEALHTPRLDTPRARVAGGSVAIGASRVGIYPAPSPGGWNIVGRTPVPLFDHRVDPPTPLALGDRVRLVPISRAEFDERTR